MRFFGRLLILTGLAVLAALPARAGEIATVVFHSAALDRPWDYNVYLPDAYARGQERYPVLYLLHGFGNDRNEWVVRGQIGPLADKMIAEGKIPPCIVVMPSAGQSWYLDGAEPMERAIVEDLVPEVEGRFRTEAQREGRLIAGVSMGGYGALHLALDHPEIFAAAALLSPAIYDPLPPDNSASRRSAVFFTDGHFNPALWEAMNYPTLLDRFRAKGLRVPVFVVAGSEDELHIYGHVSNMARLWNANHWPGTFLVLAGHHNFKMWRRVMPDALRFLFRQIVDPDTRLATGLPHQRTR